MKENMSRDIFRAYDIRGIAYQDLTPKTVYQIARGLAVLLNNLGDVEPTVVVAYDNRLSSPSFANVFQRGLLASGCKVINIGMVPTPLLYFATHTLEAAHHGVMITASHNPKEYNGFKIVVNKQSLSEEDILHLYRLAKNEKAAVPRHINVLGSLISERVQKVDIASRYIDEITQQYSLKHPLKVVVDCANAVAGNIAPKLLRALGCEVETLYCDLDGRFPNHSPDPSEKKNLNDLVARVKAVKADLGIAYDGDADRVFFVDEKGDMVESDQMIMLFAQAILENKKDQKIIYDVKCSQQIKNLVQNLGGFALINRTGHTFIKQRVKEENAAFAGEASGHYVFNDSWYGFDDGLYASVRLLALLSNQGTSLSKQLAKLPKIMITPEIKVSVKESEKFELIRQFKTSMNVPGANIIDLDGVRVELPDGWGLIRASNTSPYVVLRFEAENHQALEAIQGVFKSTLSKLPIQVNIAF